MELCEECFRPAVMTATLDHQVRLASVTSPRPRILRHISVFPLPDECAGSLRKKTSVDTSIQSRRPTPAENESWGERVTV